MQSDLQDLFKGAGHDLLDGVISKLDQEKTAVLTELEKDISILLWMNFDHYEIAQLLHVELADVEMERERIREKLALDGKETIQLYIQTNLA